MPVGLSSDPSQVKVIFMFGMKQRLVVADAASIWQRSYAADCVENNNEVSAKTATVTCLIFIAFISYILVTRGHAAFHAPKYAKFTMNTIARYAVSRLPVRPMQGTAP